MMCYKKVLFLFVGFTFVLLQALNAQIVEAQLMQNGYSREELGVRLFKDTAFCKNIPFKTLPFWSLRRTTIDPVQANYERVLDGKMTQKSWVWFVNEYKLDTTRISKIKIAKNHVHIATAIDGNGVKYISIDANNNRDFSDDKIFSFDPKAIKRNYPEVNVSVDYFNGQSLAKANVLLMIDAYQGKFPNSAQTDITDAELDLTVLKLSPNYYGKLKIGKEEYNLSVYNEKQYYETPNFRIEVRKIDSIQGSNAKFSYTSKDTINIQYQSFSFESFNNGKLKLATIGRNKYAGAEVNTLAPPIDDIEFISKSPFSLKKYSDSYILIDFWGSWCNPCIKAIPDLKKAFEKLKSKVVFVSVAFDKVEDKKKLENLINQYEMTWHHLFDNMRAGKQSISMAYKVQEYPTTIIIDPKGKVVFRSVAKEGLERAVQYLTDALTQSGR